MQFKKIDIFMKIKKYKLTTSWIFNIRRLDYSKSLLYVSWWGFYYLGCHSEPIEVSVWLGFGADEAIAQRAGLCWNLWTMTKRMGVSVCVCVHNTDATEQTGGGGHCCFCPALCAYCLSAPSNKVPSGLWVQGLCRTVDWERGATGFKYHLQEMKTMNGFS